jgi:LPXTG-site transpeptidase (sortase) family protein
MSEKPSQSLSANSGIYLSKAPGRGWRIAATVFGLFVLVYGAADLSSRAAHAAFGANASLYAFGPAISLVNLRPVSTPTATPALAATSSAGSVIPARISIPSIGVDAAVEQVGKKDDGSMDTPKKFGDVAWYSPGSQPGAAGNAVIDGHVNNALTTAGVFQHLSQIALGDKITVTNASGTPVSFTVTNIEEYPVDTAPAASIFATTGPSQLVLITCDGVWVPSEKSFDKRLVVFASKV